MVFMIFFGAELMNATPVAVMGLGLDLWGLPAQDKAIWFAVLVLMTVGIGLIAPPVGLSI